MRRRDFLTSASMLSVLAASGLGLPALAAASEITFTFVPLGDLASLDPVWTTAHITGFFGLAVYDTLYGLDSDFQPQPQMAKGHSVSDDGLLWTIELREGLSFHDGSPVTAADCVASLKRWAVRDALGKHLMSLTEELAAPDAKTITFKLSAPFPLLTFAIAKPSAPMAAMMPARLAETDAHTQLKEAIGSGPYKFAPELWVSGSSMTLLKNEAYVPRAGDKAALHSGPKTPHIDRVVWKSITDPTTAINALIAGEVDAVDQVPTDFLPLLQNNPDITLVNRRLWTLPIIRLNHLVAPFNDEKVRQAILSAVDQTACMTAVFGADFPDAWRGETGFFVPDTPLHSEAGLELVRGARDLEAARAVIAASGYKGEPIVLLDPVDGGWQHLASLVTADLLQKLGFNVEVQALDWGTVAQRRQVKESPAENKAGWHVYCTSMGGFNCLTPMTHLGLRSDGEKAWFGWPDNAEMEALRVDWSLAQTLEEQQEIAAKIQVSAFRNVPYIPMGAYRTIAAYASKWVDTQPEPLFYGMKRAEK